jgi:hypothetical protein
VAADVMDLIKSTLFKSQPFYRAYIIQRWSTEYFPYDELKAELGSVQSTAKPLQISAIDDRLHAKILTIEAFISGMITRDSTNLDVIKSGWNNLDDADKAMVASLNDSSAELVARLVFEDTQDLLKYLYLNEYMIIKCKNEIGNAFKKLESIVEAERPNASDIEMGADSKGDHSASNNLHPSIIKEKTILALSKLSNQRHQIEALQKDCVRLFSKFRERTDESLVQRELEYPTEDFLDSKDNFDLGLKLGLAIAILLFTLFNSVITKHSFRLYDSDGIFIFTFVGNMLLFQLCWAVVVYVWEKYMINYVAIMKLARKRNYMRNIESVTTLFIFYGLLLVLYLETNSKDSNLYSRRVGKYLPVALLLVGAACVAWKSWNFGNPHLQNSSIYTTFVLKNCLMAPFSMFTCFGSSPTFRDTYAANVLSSFTKVTTDLMRGMCWIIDGLLINNGSEKGSGFCISIDMDIIMTTVVTYLVFIRLAQCIRQWIETGQARHGLNALKYALTVLSVVYGFFVGLTPGYLALSLVAAIYKWQWDVIVDWGLGQSSSENQWLRTNIMIKSTAFYYVCIFLDLIFRFLWTISLRPSLSVLLFGPMASTLLGSLEIIRRAAWSVIRLEWEHTKRYSNNNMLRVKVLMSKDTDPEDWGENNRKTSLVTQGKSRKVSQQPEQKGTDVTTQQKQQQLRAPNKITPVLGGHQLSHMKRMSKKNVSNFEEFEEVLANVAWGGTYTT